MHIHTTRHFRLSYGFSAYSRSTVTPNTQADNSLESLHAGTARHYLIPPCGTSVRNYKKTFWLSRRIRLCYRFLLWKEGMVRSSLRPAAASGLLAAVALFAAPSLTTITTTTAQSQQDSNCASFNSSSTAGILEGNLIAEPTYFGCGDDGFLVAVEASYFSSLGTLSWT